MKNNEKTKKKKVTRKSTVAKVKTKRTATKSKAGKKTSSTKKPANKKKVVRKGTGAKTKKKANKVKTSKQKTTKSSVRKKQIVKEPIVNSYSDFKYDVENPFNTKDEQINDSFKDRQLKLSMIVNVVLVSCVIILGFLYFKGGIFTSTSRTERKVLSKLPEYAESTYLDTYKEFYKRAFVKNDYVGQIIFESGIINEPVMQGDTNETYLRRNFETYKYEVCGPVFADYICDVESDQNIILYGHNRSTGVDPEHIMMFSPLHVLENQENYDENKLIYMVYGDRVDVYLVASVYPIKVIEKEDGNQYLLKGEPLYYLDNYGVEEFKTYIEGVKARQLYETGVEITNSDKLLTLQTCYEDKLDKLIILAKKVKSLEYKTN